jgi:hypothetical protein
MINKIVNIVLVFVILILLWRGCDLQSEKKNLLKQVSAYQIGEKAFKQKMKDDSSTIATQDQTILTQNEAIRLGILKLDGQIKKASSQVSVVQRVRIDSVEVPFIPSGYMDSLDWVVRIRRGDTSRSICDSLIANSIIVPSDFGVDNKWYKIYGKVKKDGLLVDSLSIANESKTTIGWKKGGFLNLKKIPIVEVTNSNPYIKVDKMNNVVVEPNKSIFQKKGFWLGLGTIIGVYLQTKL